MASFLEVDSLRNYLFNCQGVWIIYTFGLSLPHNSGFPDKPVIGFYVFSRDIFYFSDMHKGAHQEALWHLLQCWALSCICISILVCVLPTRGSVESLICQNEWCYSDTDLHWNVRTACKKKKKRNGHKGMPIRNEFEDGFFSSMIFPWFFSINTTTFLGVENAFAIF